MEKYIDWVKVTLLAILGFVVDNLPLFVQASTLMLVLLQVWLTARKIFNRPSKED